MKARNIHSNLAAAYAISPDYAGHLTQAAMYQRCCLEQTREMVETVANGVANCIAIYDQHRQEYNRRTQHPHALLHLTPYLRRTIRNNELYLSIVWARFVNDQYLRNPSRNPTRNKIREIKRRGGQHYTERDLKSALNAHNLDALPLLLQCEHILRYWRREYGLLQAIRHQLKMHRKSEFQSLMAHESAAILSEQFLSPRLQVMNDQLNAATGLDLPFDPYGLTRSESLLNIDPDCVRLDPVDEFDPADLDDTIPL